MATIDTDPGTIYDAPTLVPVEVIPYLSDPGGWQTQPHLYATQLTIVTNGISRAVLRYELGDVLQAGEDEFAQCDSLSLAGQLVRITVPQEDPIADVEWIGYLLDPRLEREGVQDVEGVNKLRSRAQEFMAVGLEYFLGRRQIDSATVHVTGSPDYVRIRRPLVFNGGPSTTLNASTAQRGNRHPDLGVDVVYHFAANPSDAEEWSADEVIDNLLKYHTPVDSTDSASPTTFWLDNAAAAILSDLFLRVETDKRTVLDVLNEICSPRRGLVWWAKTNWVAGVHDCTIHVATAATAAITLPSGGTFPANADQQTVDFDEQPHVVGPPALKRKTERWYHRVVARGARMTTTCTIGCPDGTQVIDWTDDELNGYLDGASTDTTPLPAYSELTDEEKAKRNDAYRRADVFRRVFAAFRIPADWDGKTADGAYHEPDIRSWAIPDVLPGGSVVGGLPIAVEGIRLLNRLRIKGGWDYSDDVANPTSISPSASLAEHAAPFAFVPVKTDGSPWNDDPPAKWQFVDQLADCEHERGSYVGELTTNFTVSMQESVPGIFVRAGGDAQLALALNHTQSGFRLLSDAPSATEPQVDYDFLRATVCIETDAFAEAVYEPAALPENTPIEELIIELGDDYRLDYMPAGTVFDIVEGLPQTAVYGGILRDDRLRLQDVARIAYEWYRLDRQSLTVSFKDVRNVFDLGMMITTLGSGSTQETLNTVVSRIDYDLRTMRMTVATTDDELEFRSLV